MRFKFTLFLLALNVIVFGLIGYLNHRSDRNLAQAGGLSGQIGRGLVDADRIELRGRGLDKPRIIQRKGSTWSLTEPMQWSANYFAISRILNQLQFLEEEASFSIDEIRQTGQTLADYGLEDPILELTIAEGSNALTLSIGTFTEIGNNVYLLGPDREKIFVVNRKVIDSLLVDLNDLRTREIFDIPVFEVDALGLQIRSDSAADSSSLKVRLARNNGKWSFEAPVTASADPALVGNTINTLTAAKVRRFIENNDWNLEQLGLENPFMQVTIHGNKRRQTLVIGNRYSDPEGPAQYYAKLEDNPVVFTVLARPFDALREAQEALRERNFMNFDVNDLSTINITEKDRTLRLQRLETGRWQVLESSDDIEIQPRRADPEVIKSLLDDIIALRAIDFVFDTPSAADNEQLGFNQPRRIVRLNFNQREPITMQLAHPEDENDRLYAKTNQADFIYAVDRRSTLGMFPLNTLHYRNRTLEALPQAARIQRLELYDIANETHLLDLQLTSAADNWTLELSKLDDTKSVQPIEQLLDTLRNFRVKRYLLDQFGEAYPVDKDRALPWSYRLRATIELPGGETDRIETLEYVFTERLSGTFQVGGSGRHNSIFEIPQALIDALYELTDEMELPPEATGAPIPEPRPVTAVEEPVAVEPIASE